eukprot:GHVN01020486.1.p1 GENE.GHVN01020486.1~~GHVN01020486.1.p1  ORF type:complete len:1431 (+),score=217.95 GHVN01020486.1:66-4358(+)
MDHSVCGIRDGVKLGLRQPGSARAELCSHDALIKRLTQSVVLEGHQGCVNRLAWSENGEFLASGSDDKRVLIWGSGNGWMSPEPLHSVETGHTQNIFGVGLLGTDQIVSGSMDCEVRLVSMVNPSARSVYHCHAARVKHIATLPKNSLHLWWSASEDGTVRQFDSREHHSCNSHQFDCRNVLINVKTRHSNGRRQRQQRLIAGLFGGTARPLRRRRPGSRDASAQLQLQSRCGRISHLPAKELATIAEERKWGNDGLREGQAKAVAINPMNPHYIAIANADPLIRIYDRRMLAPRRRGGGGRTFEMPCQVHLPKHLWGLPFESTSHGYPDTQKQLLSSTHVAWRSDGKELVASYSNEQVYVFPFFPDNAHEEVRMKVRRRDRRVANSSGDGCDSNDSDQRPRRSRSANPPQSLPRGQMGWLNPMVSDSSLPTGTPSLPSESPDVSRITDPSTKRHQPAYRPLPHRSITIPDPPSAPPLPEPPSAPWPPAAANPYASSSSTELAASFSASSSQCLSSRPWAISHVDTYGEISGTPSVPTNGMDGPITSTPEEDTSVNNHQQQADDGANSSPANDLSFVSHELGHPRRKRRPHFVSADNPLCVLCKNYRDKATEFTSSKRRSQAVLALSRALLCLPFPEDCPSHDDSDEAPICSSPATSSSSSSEVGDGESTSALFDVIEMRRRVLCERALALLQRKAQGDALIAEHDATSALSLDPGSAPAIALHIRSLQQTKRFANGVRIAAEAVNSHPTVKEFPRLLSSVFHDFLEKINNNSHLDARGRRLREHLRSGFREGRSPTGDSESGDRSDSGGRTSLTVTISAPGDQRERAISTGQLSYSAQSTEPRQDQQDYQQLQTAELMGPHEQPALDSLEADQQNIDLSIAQSGAQPSSLTHSGTGPESRWQELGLLTPVASYGMHGSSPLDSPPPLRSLSLMAQSHHSSPTLHHTLTSPPHSSASPPQFSNSASNHNLPKKADLKPPSAEWIKKVLDLSEQPEDQPEALKDGWLHPAIGACYRYSLPTWDPWPTEELIAASMPPAPDASPTSGDPSSVGEPSVHVRSETGITGPESLSQQQGPPLPVPVIPPYRYLQVRPTNDRVSAREGGGDTAGSGGETNIEANSLQVPQPDLSNESNIRDEVPTPSPLFPDTAASVSSDRDAPAERDRAGPRRRSELLSWLMLTRLSDPDQAWNSNYPSLRDEVRTDNSDGELFTGEAVGSLGGSQHHLTHLIRNVQLRVGRDRPMWVVEREGEHSPGVMGVSLFDNSDVDSGYDEDSEGESDWASVVGGTEEFEGWCRCADDLQWRPQGVAHRFVGHSNIATDIKEAAFWGNNCVLSGSDDGTVFIWRRHDGELLNVLNGHMDSVNCVQVHPTETTLATSGIDNYVQLWRPGETEFEYNGSVEQKIRTNQRSRIFTPSFTRTVNLRDARYCSVQ